MKRIASLLALVMGLGLGAVACEQQGGGGPAGQSPGASPGATSPGGDMGGSPGGSPPAGSPGSPGQGQQ